MFYYEIVLILEQSDNKCTIGNQEQEGRKCINAGYFRFVIYNTHEKAGSASMQGIFISIFIIHYM